MSYATKFPPLLVLFVLAVIALPLPAQHFPSIADSWRQTAGPYTGKIMSMIELDNGALLAGSEGGGLFRRSDPSQPWAPHALTSLAGSSIHALIRHADGRLFAGLEFNMAVSSDNGDSWTPVAIPSSQNGFGLALGRDGTLYLAGWAGLHASNDAGATWTEIMSGLPNVSVNAVAVDSAGNLYSAHQNLGLYRSTDKGGSWNSVSSEIEVVTVKCITVATDGTIYAGTIGLGVAVSTDNGATWTLRAEGIAKPDITALHADAAGILAGTAGGYIYHSTDKGVTWTELFHTQYGGGILCFSKMGSIVAAGTSWEGVLTGNATKNSWGASSEGLINLAVPSFTSNSKGTIFMVNPTYEDVMLSKDGGATWTKANGGQYRNVRSACVMPHNDYLYIGTPRGVYHSTDDGATWTHDIVGMTNRDVRMIAVSPTQAIFASCYGKNLYRSVDYGQSWSLVSETFNGGEISLMRFTEDGVIFAGTETRGIYRSRDNGLTWSSIQSGLNRTLVTAICYDKDHGLYHGSYGEVHYSSDRGDSWSRITNDLPVASVNAIEIGRSGQPAIGMEVKGCYYYDRVARHWIEANDGLFNKSILAFHRHTDGSLLAGTNGNGLFIIDKVPTGVDKTREAAPYDLYVDVYPNPVSDAGTLTMRMYGAGQGQAQIHIADILGRVVSAQTIETATPFTTFPLQGLAPGMYTLRVQTAGRSASTSFIVQR